MTPISIVIKGLYSYQEEQTIEFDKLLAGQLFGIFGSVGSGKSSILEAIAFALYGETERMNRHDNRGYNMMNLKSNELWIDFQFRSYDEFTYRFTVRGKRHGKDFAKVGSFERSAYKLGDDGWEPLELKSAEDVLGLSYINFRRTIIIPQGRFQEFLQLGDKARTDMLKEIFDLSKYEFFLQTTTLERKNKDAMHILRGQLLQFDSIEKSYLDEKELSLKQLNTSLTEQQEKLLKKREELEGLVALKRQFDQKSVLQNELEEMLQMESDILETEKKIQEYEYCIIHFKDKLNRKEELESLITKQTQDRQDTQRQIRENMETLKDVNQKLEALEVEYKRKDEYKEQIADYESGIQLNLLEKKFTQLESRKESGEQHIQATILEREQKKSEYEAIKKEKKRRQSALPDMIVLSDLRTWYDKKASLEKSIIELNNRLENEEIESNLLIDKIKTQLTDSLLAGVEMGLAPEYHLKSMEELMKQIQEEQGYAQSQIDQYRLQAKLGEFTGILKSGEACMLCGSTSHPKIMEIGDVDMHLKKEVGKLDNLKRRERRLGEFMTDLSHYIQVLGRLSKTMTAIKQKRENEEIQLREHIDLFKWSAFSMDEPQQLDEAFKNSQILQEQIKVDEKLEQELEEELGRLQAQQEKYGKALQGFERDAVKVESEIQTLRKNLKRLRSEDYKGFDERQLMEVVSALKKTIENNSIRFEEYTDRQTKLKGGLIGLNERLAFLQNGVEESQGKLLLLNQNLQEVLQRSPFSDLKSIHPVLSQDLDIESLKKDTVDYRQKVYSVRKQLESLEIVLKNKMFDEEKFRSLEATVAEFKTKLEDDRAYYIKEKSIFEREQSDFNKKKDLLSSLQQLEKRSSNIDLLKKLFKGSGFVSYISRVYLQNLCLDANKRFYRLTNQQLQLEVDADNNFQVRDFLNNGRIRSIKTLSGGQTFQASLSLALALAESVQQQNKSKQNFFFLDEGFGSLDRESLQTALTTLKMLRKENRMVGVISHVEELQQEIDVFLHVHKDAVRGSLISNNWV